MKNAEQRNIAIKEIETSDMNPRQLDKTSQSYKDLVASIKANGVQVPIALEQIGKEKYRIIYGERRYTAAKELKLFTIPALVYSNITDQEVFDMTYHENFDREDLTIKESIKAVNTLFVQYGKDLKAVASKLGLTPMEASRRLHCSLLSPKILKAMDDIENPLSKFTFAHLELIGRLPKETQEEFADEVKDNDRHVRSWDGTICSVKELNTLINGQFLHRIKSMPWAATECESCVRRSDKLESLFGPEDIKQTKGAACLDIDCWKLKHAAYIEARMKAATEKNEKLALMTDSSCSNETIESLKRKYPTVQRMKYDMIPAPKSDTKAMPVFMLTGKDAGDVVYVRSRNSAVKKSITMPKTLGDKKDMLRRKRWAESIKRLSALVEKHKGEHLTNLERTGLLVTFGTSTCDDTYCPGDWTRYIKIMQASNMLEIAWSETRQVLCDRLKCKRPVTQTPDELIEEAEKIATLLKIDLKAIFSKVSTEKDFTDPKSWTPKVADCDKCRKPHTNDCPTCSATTGVPKKKEILKAGTIVA